MIMYRQPYLLFRYSPSIKKKRIYALSFYFTHAVTSLCHVSSVNRFVILFQRSKVFKDRHFSCEDCDGTVSGGFDAASSQVRKRSWRLLQKKRRHRIVSIEICIFLFLQIVLCQNNIHQQSHMTRVVTHELIHAFDHCRAHVDWFNNYRHLACSEVRCYVGGGTFFFFYIILLQLFFLVKKRLLFCTFLKVTWTYYYNFLITFLFLTMRFGIAFSSNQTWPHRNTSNELIWAYFQQWVDTYLRLVCVSADISHTVNFKILFLSLVFVIV